MPFWKFAIVVVMLTTFTATLRHRLSDFRYLPTFDNCMMAVVERPLEQFFMLPAPLRPEEGAVDADAAETATIETGVRPAYAVATIVNVIGVAVVLSRDTVPTIVTRLVDRAPLAIPVVLIGLAMLVHAAAATAKSKQWGDDTSV